MTGEDIAHSSFVVVFLFSYLHTHDKIDCGRLPVETPTKILSSGEYALSPSVFIYSANTDAIFRWNTTRPFDRIATSSHSFSTISRMCEVRKIVFPLDAIARRLSITTLALIASMPS